MLGPFSISKNAKLDFDSLLANCLESVKSNNPYFENATQDRINPGNLTYYFRNLTILGDATIVFPEDDRHKTVNLIVEEKLEFEPGATLSTNINLKVRAATAVGDINIKSFGNKDGEHGQDAVGRATDGADGANEGFNGRNGSPADGGDGGNGGHGDHGKAGSSGFDGEDGEDGENGRSIHLLVDRFEFGSTVSLFSEGGDGGRGGKGQDGGDGGNGKRGGNGGNGGDGGVLHRAGNAGRGGNGGDGKEGGRGGNSGRNGNGGNGGDLAVLIKEAENVPWIGVVKSVGGREATRNLLAFGRGGRAGVAGEGGKPGKVGRNSVPGRSDGRPNARGVDGIAPRWDAEDGRVRSNGWPGQAGKEDGPRVAGPHDLLDFFSEMIEETINV